MAFLQPQESKQSDARRWWWMLPALLLICWLGARGLNSTSFWYDEWWALYNSGGDIYGPISPLAVLQRVAAQDPYQTPLYYLTLAGWGKLAGWTEFAGRTLSLLLGLLAVATSYQIGKTLTRRSMVGLTAAVVLGTGVFFVYFLHEMRGYTLYAWLTALCVWTYWRLLTGQITPLKQIAFTLSASALLYTHNFAGITLVGIGLYHVLFVSGKKVFPRGRWWHVVWLMLLAGLSFVPWINIVLHAVTLTRSETTRYLTTPDNMVFDIWTMFSSGGVSLLLLLALSAFWRFERKLALVWVWALTWFFLAPPIDLFVKTYETRYWMGVWPALAIIVGIGTLRSGVRPALIIIAWLVVNLWMFGDSGFNERVHWTNWHQPARELAALLTGHTRQGDLVTYHPTDNVRTWMLQDTIAYYLRKLPVHTQVFESFSAEQEDSYANRVAGLKLANAERVWVTTRRSWHADHLPWFEHLLTEQGFQQCSVMSDEREIDAKLFVRVPTAPSITATATSFEGNISAKLVKPLIITTNEDATIPLLSVLLDWTTPADLPPYTYSVALHVEDASKTLVAQTDYGLHPGCQTSDVVLSDLPAGSYELWTIVYKWQTGERLGRQPLGTFVIPGQ